MVKTSYDVCPPPRVCSMPRGRRRVGSLLAPRRRISQNIPRKRQRPEYILFASRIVPGSRQLLISCPTAASVRAPRSPLDPETTTLVWPLAHACLKALAYTFSWARATTLSISGRSCPRFFPRENPSHDDVHVIPPFVSRDCDDVRSIGYSCLVTVLWRFLFPSWSSKR